MAAVATLRPSAFLTKAICNSVAPLTDACALDSVLSESAVSSRHTKVTFIINLPWGGATLASVPLNELPLFTAEEIEQLPRASTTGASLRKLSYLVGVHLSSANLYVPGSFLLFLAATRAGLPGANEGVFNVRLLLQREEVYATTYVPLERVVGNAAAASLAASRHGAAPAEGAAAALNNGADSGAPLCSLWLLFRLPGGKGGFGALLKKQRRKKRANFTVDACRDLTGRRIRQANVVNRVKEWMEKKRKEDALVAVLTEGIQEKAPAPKPEVSLDSAFISQQMSQVSAMPDVVAQGLKKQMALRREQEAALRARAAAPQNRALYAQLRDAVEVESEDDQWSDTEDSNADADSPETLGAAAEGTSASSSSSSSSSSFSSTRLNTGGDNTAKSLSLGSGPVPSTTKAAAGSARGDSTSSNGGSNGFAQNKKADAATQALMQQLEQMRLKAAAAEAAKREERAKAEAEAAKAAAAAEQAAAEAAEKVAREAQQLDVGRFTTAEELANAVDAAVVKEKLKQLGWKCGGRPEERAARLLQLNTVDLANVPKALLARQPTRMS